MKYALLIHWDEKTGLAASAAQQKDAMAAHMAYAKALGARLVGRARLTPAAQAAQVSVRNGKRVVTDGPFAETKEVLGGFYLVEVATREEALEWAAQCPSAAHGTVEVRPVWEP